MRRTPKYESLKNGGLAVTQSRRGDMRIPAKSVDARTLFRQSTSTLRKHPDEKISTGQGSIAEIHITPFFTN
eukprot:8812285-Karenia_brevis.AAC.1